MKTQVTHVLPFSWTVIKSRFIRFMWFLNKRKRIKLIEKLYISRALADGYPVEYDEYGWTIKF